MNDFAKNANANCGMWDKDARAVIKVVRYGLNIACFPDEHTVQFVEQQIARQQTRDPVEHRRLV